MADFLIEG